MTICMISTASTAITEQRHEQAQHRHDAVAPRQLSLKAGPDVG